MRHHEPCDCAHRGEEERYANVVDEVENEVDIRCVRERLRRHRRTTSAACARAPSRCGNSELITIHSHGRGQKVHGIQNNSQETHRKHEQTPPSRILPNAKGVYARRGSRHIENSSGSASRLSPSPCRRFHERELQIACSVDHAAVYRATRPSGDGNDTTAGWAYCPVASSCSCTESPPCRRVKRSPP